MTVTAQMLEQAERARQGTIARPRIDTRALPAFAFAPFVRCPACGCAAEDGMNLHARLQPFRGIACFHCGACHNSNGQAGYARLDRVVKASNPPVPVRDSIPAEAWGTVTRLP